MTTFDLAAWRARMGLTQAGAAMLLGTSVRTIAGVEMGERPPSRLLVAACHWHEHQRSIEHAQWIKESYERLRQFNARLSDRIDRDRAKKA